MKTNRHRIALVLFLTPLVAAPSIAAASGYVSIHVGSGGAGFSAGSTDWAVYGASWNDANWGGSYETHLAGYGEWVHVDGIGEVWRPWVAAGWRPYTYGRWVGTSMGWTWIAYEPWGYFPHHYGNWAMTTFGWVWVPGWTYRPATVSWVTCGSYVGWYPTAPPGWVHSERAYSHGWRNGYRSGYNSGYYDGWRDARHATWVPWGKLGEDNLSRHAMSYQNVSHNRQSQPQGISAPDRATVARRGATVPSATLEQRTAAVGDRQLTFARPRGFGTSVVAHGENTVRNALSSRVNRPAKETERSQQGTSRAATERSNLGAGVTSARHPVRANEDRSLRRGAREILDPRSLAPRTISRDTGSPKSSSHSQRARISRQPQDSRAAMERSSADRGASIGRTSREPGRGSAPPRAEGDHGSNSAAPHPGAGSRYGGGQHHSHIQAQDRPQPVSRDRGESSKRGRSAAQPRSATIPGNAVIQPAPRGSERQKSPEAAGQSRDDQRRSRGRQAGK